MRAMASRRGGNSPEEEEGEGDVFNESFDRILSSSCSSTSASASDDESSSGRRRARLRFPSLSSLDVWSAEPTSVEERRRLLLRHLGLSGDPTLARLPRSPGAHAEVGISVESGRFAPRANHDAIALSSSPSSLGKSSPQQQFHVPIRSSPSRKPLSNGVLVVSDGHRRIDGEQPLCSIKNLDNGIEFVVKELREDGMWITLSELGTERELTAEEFDMCVERSPIVQKLLRRQNAKEATDCSDSSGSPGGRAAAATRAATGGRFTGSLFAKKRLSWFRNIKNVAEAIVAIGNGHSRRSIAEKYPAVGKGGRLSSSATEGSLEGSHGLHLGLERIKVRRCGKSDKELSDLYMCQEIQAHSGSIWSIRFSSDGQYLASAGEDCIIHVRKVSEFDRRDDMQNEKASQANDGNHLEKNSKAKILGSLKSSCSHDSPENVFALSEKPVCSLQGHQDDILDLRWSKSMHLLSSSMDKTVRLWHISCNSCLKVFSHSDYVTCIQFNPVDDRYFISGSLDGKVRIWSFPDHQVVDWNDLHEMVTAACYTPDGQGVLVGSNKGNCHLYDTSDNKFLQRSQIDLQIKKKKSRIKKITGFQFIPGSPSKVIITSADSRIRVIDGDELVHKFKGFRNTGSQISASFTPKGKHVICASEDSRVCMWRYNDSPASRSKAAATVTRTYEDFHCHGVTAAVPWPNPSAANLVRTCPIKQHGLGAEEPSTSFLVESNVNLLPPSGSCRSVGAQQNSVIRNSNSNRFSDRVSATWPEELMASHKHSPSCNESMIQDGRLSSWGLVIVTATRGGEIKIFQKFLLSKSNMKSGAS